MIESLPEESRLKSKTGPHDLDIEILGAKISITAGEEPEYLREVLSQYQIAVANTQNISKITDPLKVAILTGFLMCDSINKMKRQIKEDRAADEREIERITRNIMACIDQALEKAENLDAYAPQI